MTTNSSQDPKTSNSLQDLKTALEEARAAAESVCDALQSSQNKLIVCEQQNIALHIEIAGLKKEITDLEKTTTDDCKSAEIIKLQNELEGERSKYNQQQILNGILQNENKKWQSRITQLTDENKNIIDNYSLQIAALRKELADKTRETEALRSTSIATGKFVIQLTDENKNLREEMHRRLEEIALKLGDARLAL